MAGRRTSWWIKQTLTDRKLQTEKRQTKNIQRYYMVVDNHEEYGVESHQEMIWERHKWIPKNGVP